MLASRSVSTSIEVDLNKTGFEDGIVKMAEIIAEHHPSEEALERRSAAIDASIAVFPDNEWRAETVEEALADLDRLLHEMASLPFVEDCGDDDYIIFFDEARWSVFDSETWPTT